MPDMNRLATISTSPFSLNSQPIDQDLASPIHVLLIDDDPEALTLARIYLRSSDGPHFVTQETCTLLDGMRRLAHPGVDVVLLDLGLPELRGYKSFRAVVQMVEGRVPVVIFTGDDSSLSRRATLQDGAMDYLIKDKCSPLQLRQALSRAVNRFASPRRTHCELAPAALARA